jgi:hypothetical protein
METNINIGAIVGGTIGIVVLVILITLLVLYLYWRHDPADKDEDEDVRIVVYHTAYSSGLIL